MIAAQILPESDFGIANRLMTIDLVIEHFVKMEQSGAFPGVIDDMPLFDVGSEIFPEKPFFSMIHN